MYIAELNIAKALGERGDPKMDDFLIMLIESTYLLNKVRGTYGVLKMRAMMQLPFSFTLILPSIVNLSVWKSLEELKDYVFKTAHLEFLQRKKEWFNKMKENHYRNL